MKNFDLVDIVSHLLEHEGIKFNHMKLVIMLLFDNMDTNGLKIIQRELNKLIEYEDLSVE